MYIAKLSISPDRAGRIRDGSDFAGLIGEGVVLSAFYDNFDGRQPGDVSVSVATQAVALVAKNRFELRKGLAINGSTAIQCGSQLIVVKGAYYAGGIVGHTLKKNVVTKPYAVLNNVGKILGIGRTVGEKTTASGEKKAGRKIDRSFIGFAEAEHHATKKGLYKAGFFVMLARPEWMTNTVNGKTSFILSGDGANLRTLATWLSHGLDLGGSHKDNSGKVPIDWFGVDARAARKTAKMLRDNMFN